MNGSGWNRYLTAVRERRPPGAESFQAGPLEELDRCITLRPSHQSPSRSSFDTMEVCDKTVVTPQTALNSMLDKRLHSLCCSSSGHSSSLEFPNPSTLRMVFDRLICLSVIYPHHWKFAQEIISQCSLCERILTVAALSQHQFLFFSRIDIRKTNVEQMVVLHLRCDLSNEN